MNVKIVLPILGFIFIGCKSEVNSLTTAEQIYFEDYQTPIDKWGFIDSTSQLVIEPKYDNARDFENGRAAVNYKGKWGVIDLQGKTIIPFDYRQLSIISEGVIIATPFEGPHKIFDKDGNLQFQYSATSIFPRRNKIFRILQNEVYGYVDNTGQLLIEATYLAASDFMEDMAIVSMGRYGVIDKNNNAIIPLVYEDVRGPRFGYFTVKSEEGWQLFDAKEKRLINRYFKSIEILNSDFAVVKDARDEAFLYNIRANSTSRLEYDMITDGGEGKFHFYQDGKMGVLNKDLELITTAQYDMLYRFSEDYAAYMRDNGWGYLDHLGNEKTPPVFPLAWNFKNGYTRVILPEGSGFIDRDFQLIIPRTYREVRDFSNGLARVQVPK